MSASDGVAIALCLILQMHVCIRWSGHCVMSDFTDSCLHQMEWPLCYVYFYGCMSASDEAATGLCGINEWYKYILEFFVLIKSYYNIKNLWL